MMMMIFSTSPKKEYDHSIGQWLVDSGASNHYTARKDILYDFIPIDPIWIMTGKGYISANGIGHVIVHLSIGKVIIKNVMWVSELKGFASLLSVPQLTDNGFKITFEWDDCEILHRNQLIVKGTKKNKVYYLDVTGYPNKNQSNILEGAKILGLIYKTINIDLDLYTGHRMLKLTTYAWLEQALKSLHLIVLNTPNITTPNITSQRITDVTQESAMLYGTEDTQSLET